MDHRLRLISLSTLKPFLVPDDDKWGLCRSIDRFEILNTIGEGAYGVVYRAINRRSREIFALKRVKMNPGKQSVVGIPVTALREINILLNLQHEHLVNFKEVFVDKDLSSIYLAMEFCDHDLASICDNLSRPFDEAQVKCVFLQVLAGLRFLHINYVIHRDLKLSNLLMTSKGQIKIADLGLSRIYQLPLTPMSPNVVTLWYRSPEILLGASHQTTGIDIWAGGCILAELLLWKPFMPGRTEIEQIDYIIKQFGSPTNKIWPEMDQLPLLKKFTLRNQPYNTMKQTFPRLSESGLALLNSMFTYDPTKRVTASACADSDYFLEAPLPCEPEFLPILPDYRSKVAGNEGTRDFRPTHLYRRAH